MKRIIIQHDHKKPNREYQDYFSEAYREIFPSNEKNSFDILPITFQVTENCNLACTYCYQINKSPKRMTLDIAKRAIDMIMSDNIYCKVSEKKGCILEFIGGEPLLEIDLIEEIYKYFIQKCITENHPWLTHHRISMCSNGVLFQTEKVQSFLEKYGRSTSISITIDGPKRLHDACRVFHDGSGSYDIVSKSVHLLQNRYGIRTTKVTIAPQNLPYLSDLVKHFVTEFQFNEINANCTFEGPWTIDDAKLFYHELKNIANYCYDHDTYHDLYISLFDETLFSPIDYSDPDNNRNWCGGTGLMIAVDPDGVFYPCIRYMPSSLGDKIPPIRIGDLDTGIVKSPCDVCTCKYMENITATSQSSDTCIHCPIASGCAWCSGYNYQETGSMNKRVTHICIMHKARALANAYYWNRFYEKHDIQNVHELYLSKEDALRIIDIEEYEMLQKLITNQKWKVGDR